MSPLAQLLKKAIKSPDLAPVSFDIAVLDRYLAQNDVSVKRTNTVGRVKAATWSADFGIAPDEKSVHLSLAQLSRLPDAEQAHWLSHADEARFSTNFLKMQASHACIDDGNLRAWGEPATESFF